jgi:hypothetical protein
MWVRATWPDGFRVIMAIPSGMEKDPPALRAAVEDARRRSPMGEWWCDWRWDG